MINVYIIHRLPEGVNVGKYRNYGGGAREGAGRPKLGETRRIALTLPAEAWAWLDECIENGHALSRSELLRDIIAGAKGDMLYTMKRR